MLSSNTVSPTVDVPGVDPKLLRVEIPQVSSMEAFVTIVDEMFPSPDPWLDVRPTPSLVPDDGGSQSAMSPLYTPLCSPQLDYVSIRPQSGLFDHDLLLPPVSPVSPLPPSLPTPRVLIEAPCAKGRPIKQKDGYRCSACEEAFKRRDDAKRHIDSTGMRVTCRYCGKPASGRRDGQRRHLLINKTCLKIWTVGYEAGLFTERSVQDAYN